MKRTYVQCAELVLASEADPAAPGGAVTLALCGSWYHEGPCRWPHETSAVWDDRRGQVRVVFVADEEEETSVRTEIDRALAGGECVGPDGSTSRWEVQEQGAGALSEVDEAWGVKIAETYGAEGHVL